MFKGWIHEPISTHDLKGIFERPYFPGEVVKLVSKSSSEKAQSSFCFQDTHDYNRRGDPPTHNLMVREALLPGGVLNGVNLRPNPNMSQSNHSLLKVPGLENEGYVSV
jgi:hypothetical protein